MNQQAMLRKLRQMQNEMLEAQKQINETNFTVSRGPVTVSMFGNREGVSVKIDDSFEIADQDDKEMLEDSIAAAFSAIDDEIQSLTEEKLGKYQSMPGMF